MKRASLILCALAALLVASTLWAPWPWKTVRTVAPEHVPAPGEIQVTETSSGAAPAPAQAPQLLGESILRDYAKPGLPPRNDLTLISRLMQNSVLLLKSAANRPLSANEDWADFFKGKNAMHERFLPDNHASLNSAGQLVDRWGTPLFFHALGNNRYEVRSAGPDKMLWTADDIHLAADGTFSTGSNLNSSTLSPSAPARSTSRR